MKERSKAELLAELRNDLALVPGMNITIGQPISHRIDHMISGTRASIAIKIFGEDLYELRRLARTIRDAIEPVAGVVDLNVEQQMDVPLLSVTFMRDSIAHYGVSIADISRALEAGFQGVRTTTILEGQQSFDLVARVAEGEGWSSSDLLDLPVDTPAGAKIPLKVLARIEKSTGPNMISREQVTRKIVVSCNVSGRDVASVVEDCRAIVDPIVAEEAGYRVQYGGQFESANEATRLLSILTVGIVIGIGFLLNIAFRSARDALLVMVNLPLALIGGVGGRLPDGRRPLRRFAHRLHHRLRHRDAQRHHARLAYPSPAGQGGRDGFLSGRLSGSNGTPRSDPDDRFGDRAGIDPTRPERRQTRQ